MKRTNKIMLIVVFMGITGLASANQSAQRLGVCFNDSMTGHERKELAKWIFLGIATHSTIQPFANVTDQDRDDANRFLGALVTRLLTENCPAQAKAAFQDNGAKAFEHAFKVVGEVAMQELMTEPAVSASLGAFDRYLDLQKIEQVFGE